MSNFGLVDSRRLNTKKALKLAVLEGESVMVFDTSLHNPRGTINIRELRPSDVIVGPNVYDNRKWYANYKDGKVV